MKPDSSLIICKQCTTPIGFALVAVSPQGLKQLHISNSAGGIEPYVNELVPYAVSLDRVTRSQRDLLRVCVELVSTGKSLEQLPLDLSGTAFQIRVWSYLRTVPPGEVCSYQAVAKALGLPHAYRAVAQACSRNSIALAIPCHRVVRSDGSLGGYRWGVHLKRRLIESELQHSEQSACIDQ